MQVEQRARTLPYGWVGFFILLAVVAFIGLYRRQEPPPLQPIVARGTSASDRAESAQIVAGLAKISAPVDVRQLLRQVAVQDDTATVTVDERSYASLSADEQAGLFDAVAAAWSRAYRAQHRGALDRPISMDFIDTSKSVVHHRLIEPE